MSETLKTKDNFSTEVYNDIVELERRILQLEQLATKAPEDISDKVYRTAGVVAESLRKELAGILSRNFQDLYHPRPKKQEEQTNKQTQET